MIATLCNPDFVMTASFPFTRPSSITPRASARSTVDGRWVSIHCPGKRLLDLAQEWEGRTGARRSNYPPSGQVGSNAPLRSPSRRRKRSEIPIPSTTTGRSRSMKTARSSPPRFGTSQRNRRKPRHVVVSSKFGSPVCIRTSAVAIPRQAYPIWRWSG